MTLNNLPAQFPTILSTIGNTPIVQLVNIPKNEGLQCRILAKCEFFNPGGSVKDRIALAMVEDGERKGYLEPGKSTLIEPTSGNTGIGLAMVGAVKGYRVIVTMPEKMSMEKVNLLRALGAEVRRTPTNVPFDHPESHISLAKRLQKEIPHSVILDQYGNVNNPLAHEQTTAQEILQATNNGKEIDVIIMGAGTGGTVAGVGRAIKKAASHIRVIAVDPLGSALASHKASKTISKDMYLVEGLARFLSLGIGYDFIPDVLDYSSIDEWVSVNDKDSFVMARRLIKEEGILCGGSSGSVASIAVKLGKDLSSKQTILIILPDSVRNYMSKFIRDEWMALNNFAPYPELLIGHSTLQSSKIIEPFVCAKSSDSSKDILKQFFKLEYTPPLILILKEKPLFCDLIEKKDIEGILTLKDALQFTMEKNKRLIPGPLDAKLMVTDEMSVEGAMEKMKASNFPSYLLVSTRTGNAFRGLVTQGALIKAQLGNL